MRYVFVYFDGAEVDARLMNARSPEEAQREGVETARGLGVKADAASLHAIEALDAPSTISVLAEEDLAAEIAAKEIAAAETVLAQAEENLAAIRAKHERASEAKAAEVAAAEARE